MRLWLVLGGLMCLVGCAGPHSTGALWAQQSLDQELALFRLSDAQRADQAQTFELTLADRDLAAERARIMADLQTCPGSSRQALGLSSGDRLRDTIRLRAQGDATRLASVAQIALADWRVRRAQATGEARFCDESRQALSGARGEPSASDLLSRLGPAVVSRDPLGAPPADASNWSADETLSNYALGYVDAVQAASPLPQYLAAVYGGTLVQRPSEPDLAGRDAASVVDDLAPAYPAWEPDAIYLALATDHSAAEADATYQAVGRSIRLRTTMSRRALAADHSAAEPDATYRAVATDHSAAKAEVTYRALSGR